MDDPRIEFNHGQIGFWIHTDQPWHRAGVAGGLILAFDPDAVRFLDDVPVGDDVRLESTIYAENLENVGERCRQSAHCIPHQKKWSKKSWNPVFIIPRHDRQGRPWGCCAHAGARTLIVDSV